MLRPLDPRTMVVQVRGTLTGQEYAQLNELIREHPTVTLRVFTYDDEESPQDLRFLVHLPDLRALQVGWPNLRELHGLEAVSATLVSLTLQATQKGKCPLEPVRQLRVLESFGCAETYTGLAAVADLVSLRELRLAKTRIETWIDLPFRSSIEALSLWGPPQLTRLELPEAMNGLRYFQLQRSTSVVDLEVLGGLDRLECLVLDHLPALVGLPDLRRLHRLTRVEIIGCKRLVDIGALEFLPNLRELVLHQMPMAAEALAPLAASTTLRAATLGLDREREARWADELFGLSPVPGPNRWEIPRIRRPPTPAAGGD